MITEKYVSFEVAKLLKEKGFDEKCQKVFNHNGQLLWAQIFMEGESFVDNKCIELVANYNNWNTHAQGEYAYLCPTLQMAMEWLRKTHNIHIAIVPCEVGPGVMDYTYILYEVDAENFNFKDLGIQGRANTDKLSFSKTCDAGIKSCLTEVI